jgi:TolB-like protein/Tfp pilus assembly protein PilF
MRESGGRIVLMDFGTGRPIDRDHAYALADLAGTPLYLAPELFEGAVASERTDLYSLGVLLYRLVTGAFPVRAAAVEALHKAHAAGHVTRLRDLRPDLPSTFVRVIDRAIAPDPGERYGSAGELEADLGVSIHGEPIAPPASARHPMKRWTAIAIAAVTIGALGLASLRWAPFIVTKSRTGSTVVPGTIRSIAVLPLANLSGDPAQEYFADGMTDELISALGRLGGVNVISRTSVMQFKASRRSLPDIARALNVDAVLEGSVLFPSGDETNRSTGRRIRINARLIYAGTDTQLWDKTFESVLSDVLALQTRVADAVAEALKEGTDPPAAINARLRTQPTQTVTPDAYDWYLRGRYLWNKRTPLDLRRALEAFQKATEMDPNSADAWTGLADAFLLLANQGEVAPADAMPRAKAAARHALELNRASAEAHASMATIAFSYDWDFATAEAEFAQAISLNPSYANARNWHGLFLAYSGRPMEAVDELKRAQLVDPLAVVTSVNIARCFYFARDYERAVDLLRRVADQEPNFWMVHAALGQTYIASGDYDAAIDELNRARELSPLTVRNLAVLGDAYGRAGRYRQASAIARQLEETSRTRYVPPAYSALVYLGLGEQERAIDFLGKARAERSEWMTQLNMEPEFDPLRANPRFSQLVAAIAMAR